MLDVLRGGFYGWRDHPASPRNRHSSELVELIDQCLDQNDFTHGLRRISKTVNNGGRPANRRCVARLKRQKRLHPKLTKTFMLTIESSESRPVATK